MSERNFAAALARLLSDRALRAAFAANPRVISRQLGVEAEEADALASLSPETLEQQADTLLRKRLHAVGKHIPETLAALGVRAQQLFFDYAQACWPDGHLRHLVDAERFCRWLADRRLGFDRGEWNALRFTLSRARFRLYLVPRLKAGGKRRLGMQVFVRAARFSNQWRIYFAL